MQAASPDRLTLPEGDVDWPKHYVNTPFGLLLVWAEPNAVAQVRYRVGAGGIAAGVEPNHAVFPWISVQPEDDGAPTVASAHPQDVFGDAWPPDAQFFNGRYSVSGELTALDLPLEAYDPRVRPHWIEFEPEDIRIRRLLKHGYSGETSLGPAELRDAIVDELNRWLTTDDAWRFHFQATVAANVWALKALEAAHPVEMKATLRRITKPIASRSGGASAPAGTWRGRPSVLAGDRR